MLSNAFTLIYGLFKRIVANSGDLLTNLLYSVTNYENQVLIFERVVNSTIPDGLCAIINRNMYSPLASGLEEALSE
jgi:hypothetical protein